MYGIRLDSQNTPKDYNNRVMNNSFTMCKLLNSTIDNTEIIANTFYNAPSQIPITIDSSGTAIVGPNVLGGGQIITFTDGDATPSVGKGTMFKTANTGATTITIFDDGYVGQEVTVLFADNNTTLGDAAASGYFRLQGAVDHTYTPNDIASFVKTGVTEWWEKTRSVN